MEAMTSVARSFLTRAETLPRSRPPLSGGQPRRSASIAQDRLALGRAALRLAGSACGSFSCSRPISRSIGQSLANDTAQRAASPFNIVNAERDPLVVTEVELG